MPAGYPGCDRRELPSCKPNRFLLGLTCKRETEAGEREMVKVRKSRVLPVEVLISQPYAKVTGGWTGMRPVGLRRTYSATVNGTFFTNENKATFMTNIRHYCNR